MLNVTIFLATQYHYTVSSVIKKVSYSCCFSYDHTKGAGPSHFAF